MNYSSVSTAFVPLSIQFATMSTRVEAMLSEGTDLFQDTVMDISTMTLSCVLQCSRIQMDTLQNAKLQNQIAEVGCINAVTDMRFPNQLTFKVHRDGESVRPIRRRKQRTPGCNVKVSGNGSLNLTGCKSLHEGTLAVALVINAIRHAGAVEGSIALESVKVGMINIILNVPCAIRLEALKDAFLDAHLNCHFDAERHAGVQLYTDNGYAFIFRSGSITCGSSSIQNIPEVLGVVMKILSENAENVTYEDPQIRRFDRDVREAIRANNTQNNITCFG